MKVELNGRGIEVSPKMTTLEDLLKLKDLYGAGKAFAVNNKVVPVNLHSNINLEEGMKILVIKAVCGG